MKNGFEIKNPSLADLENQKQKVDEKSGWREFLRFIGPGFLVSLAYLDPANLQTDLQAGANYGYELLWVILLGLIFALVIQSLAANLGVCTGRHLSEVCRAEYPKYVNYPLWLLAEIAVISADIPEVIGTAFALNLLCHIPVWLGVLCTGLSTLLLIALQRYGVRKLEFLITFLIFVMASCFFGELKYVRPPAKALFRGMFFPKLSSTSATGDAIALLGALIMPHNLFLHSALVLSRKVPNSTAKINDACRYFLIESGFALFIAFLINVAVISVTGTVCLRKNLPTPEMEKCSDPTLDSSSFLLKHVLGKTSSTLYGIALLASGQSSAITGTYAGQYIMQGFLNFKVKVWVRNLITRSIAIIPSLAVSIIAGPSGAGRLISITAMILSFEIPFAVVPLLKFSSSAAKMGQHKTSRYIIIISWILGLGIMGINIYYLITNFVDWLLHHNSMANVGRILIGIVVFPLMAFYIFVVGYLVCRKDAIVIDEKTTDTTQT